MTMLTWEMVAAIIGSLATVLAFIYKIREPAKNSMVQEPTLTTFFQEQIKMFMAMTMSLTEIKGGIGVIKERVDGNHDKLNNMTAVIVDINTSLDHMSSSLTEMKTENKKHIEETQRRAA